MVKAKLTFILLLFIFGVFCEVVDETEKVTVVLMENVSHNVQEFPVKEDKYA